MRIALDTNRYADLARGERDVVSLLEAAERIHLPFAVLAELRAGFLAGNRTRSNEEALQRFLDKPGVELLLASEETTHLYARLHRQLRRQGTPIPINDLWIAALVVEHNLVLCSRDRHFQHLPQIQLL